VEEHIGLVVLEHLGDKLDIHIVNIDLLLHLLAEPQRWTINKQVTCRLLFNIMTASFNFSWIV
jgi:hypothetical protein